MNSMVGTKIPYVIFSMSLILFAVNAFSACDRSDVTYYLQQGFTNKEVVSLCQTTATTSNNQSSSAAMENNNQGSENNSRYKHLVNALDVTDISINQNSFNYTSPYCVNVGREDNEGYKDEECPYVRFSIDVDSMDIVRSEKRSLIKSHEILIRGDIHTTLLDDYYEKKKALIIKAIGKPKEVWIEVKRGKNVNQVMSEIREMAKALAVAK
jgi:hypothetical protein